MTPPTTIRLSAAELAALHDRAKREAALWRGQAMDEAWRLLRRGLRQAGRWLFRRLRSSAAARCANAAM